VRTRGVHPDIRAILLEPEAIRQSSVANPRALRLTRGDTHCHGAGDLGTAGDRRGQNVLDLLEVILGSLLRQGGFG
jgi:hypothetical protein